MITRQERFDKKLSAAVNAYRKVELNAIEAQWLSRLLEWATGVYDLPFTVDDVHEELGDG